jgi:hypothetical protein
MYYITKEGDNMAINGVNGVDKVNYQPKVKPQAEEAKVEKAPEKDAFGQAAVYEKADNAEGKVNKFDKGDRSAIIQQLQADAEKMKNNLFEIVKKTISGQGNAFALASEDDMWKFLASGNFTVDAATKAQAQKDIAEDGYWGVQQTSERIFDFAKALTGGDPEKMEEMREAFEKGFQQATKAWGDELPDICKQTKEAVNKLFDDYAASTKTSASAEAQA